MAYQEAELWVICLTSASRNFLLYYFCDKTNTLPFAGLTVRNLCRVPIGRRESPVPISLPRVR